MCALNNCSVLLTNRIKQLIMEAQIINQILFLAASNAFHSWCIIPEIKSHTNYCYNKCIFFHFRNHIIVNWIVNWYDILNRTFLSKCQIPQYIHNYKRLCPSVCHVLSFIISHSFKYPQPGQWHWFKHLNPSSQPWKIFNPSIGSAQEEDSDSIVVVLVVLKGGS